MAADADAVVCLVTAPPDRAHDIAETLVAKRLAPYLSWISESVDAS